MKRSNFSSKAFRSPEAQHALKRGFISAAILWGVSAVAAFFIGIGIAIESMLHH
jgi:hypothetical protein